MLHPGVATRYDDHHPLLWRSATAHGRRGRSGASGRVLRQHDKLNQQFQRLNLCDGTNFYDAVELAYELIKQQPYEMYSTSVILMTDGESNTDREASPR